MPGPVAFPQSFPGPDGSQWPAALFSLPNALGQLGLWKGLKTKAEFKDISVKDTVTKKVIFA